MVLLLRFSSNCHSLYLVSSPSASRSIHLATVYRRATMYVFLFLSTADVSPCFTTATFFFVPRGDHVQLNSCMSGICPNVRCRVAFRPSFLRPTAGCIDRRHSIDGAGNTSATEDDAMRDAQVGRKGNEACSHCACACQADDVWTAYRVRHSSLAFIHPLLATKMEGFSLCSLCV